MSRTNRDDDDQRTGQDRSGPDHEPESTVAGSGYGTFLPSDEPEDDDHDIGRRDTPPPVTEAALTHQPATLPAPEDAPVSDLRPSSPVPSAQDATLADPSAAPSVVDGFRGDQASTESVRTPPASSGSSASFEPSWAGPAFTPTPTPSPTPSGSGPGSGFASGTGGGLPSDASAELQPGQVLGSRYRVIKKLGKGGMGQVWLVRHLTLDADRALKLINPNRAFSKDFRDRFLREARAMARFVHPNVVTVHDADLRGQVAMIEMELVEGESIDRLIKKGVPMPLDWVGRVLRQLCEVLQVAHQKQIVHRDLKPPNLMLLADHREGQEFLKVLDFGIAKILGSDEQASDDAQTAAHTFMGTAPYTSPEQADGRAEPRSDIYSVGVILCEFLTGYRPFSGSLNKVIADTMTTKPPKFATLNPSANVPPAVEAVVQHCLEKDPNRRPQTPNQLWEEFLAALPEDVAEKVLGRNRPGSRPRKTTRRKPSRRQVAGAVAATALIALIASVVFWPTPPPPPDEIQVNNGETQQGGTEQPKKTEPARSDPVTGPLPPGFVAVEGTTKLNDLPKRVVHTKTGAYFDLIAGGKFTMGKWDQAEAPTLNCMLGDFYLQETEVTNRQMWDYLRAHTDIAPPDLFQQAYDNLVPKVGKAEADLHPAVGVSYELALAYARSIGATLPNEAQFEFAARSRGQNKRFPWGDEPGGPGENANIENDGAVPTVPVGKSPGDRTTQGIFDLGGNVREWCLDVWDTLPAVQVGTPALYRPVEAQPGTTPSYVIRGGSHATTSDLAETTNREQYRPADFVNADLGFRLAFEPRLSMGRQVSQKLNATPPATATRTATPPAAVAPSPAPASVPAPAPLPEPPPAIAEQIIPDRWAVIIGVGQYRPGEFGPTGGADDAKRLRDWLVQNAGWEPSHVLLVADGGAPAPADANAPNGPPNMTIRSDRAGIDHAVRAWLGPRLKPGDFALISFAGRAAAVPASNGPDDAGPARTVLVPADASRARLARDGWALGDAIDALPARGACSIVCLLDTSVEGRGRADRNATKDPEASARLLASTARWPGVSAWLAATGSPAAEDQERRGLLTASLIRALGTSEAKRPLTAVLERLRRDPDLARQGFRTLGGVDPALSVWEAPGTSLAIEDDPDYRLFLQQGHASRVSDLAFSADGSVLASAGDDSSVRLWRLDDPILLRNLAFHLAGVTRLALSPDGRLLVSGDGQGSVRGWDLASDREIVIDPTAGMPVRIDVLTFLLDGSLMAVNASGEVRAWKPDGPRFRKIDAPATASARRVVAARELGPVLAAAIEIAQPNDRVVLISDPARAGVPIEDAPKNVAEIAISPDGSRLVLGTDSGRVEVRDLADATPGKLLKSAEIGAPIRRIDMAGPSGWLLVQSGPEAAPATSFIRLDDPSRQVLLKDIAAPIRQVAVQPGGGRIVVLAGDQAHAWDLGGEADAPRAIELSGLGDDASAISSIAIDPNGTRLAIGSEDGGVRVRPVLVKGEKDESDGSITFPPHLGQVAGLTASGDGTHLLTIQRDGHARAWSMPARKARVIEGLYQPAGAFLGGTSLAALIKRDGSIAIVDRDTGRQRLSLDPPDDANWELTRLAASPDGRLLAAGSASLPLVAVWALNLDEGATKPPGPPTLLRAPHEGPIVGLAFADEGRSLITADDTGTVACWAVEAGLVQAAKGPTRTHKDKDTESPLFALAVESGAGTRVALGQGRFQGNRWRGRVSLWDRASDAVSTVSLDGVEGVLGTLAFSRDNAVLTAGGTSRRLHAWALLGGDRVRALNLRGGHDEQINAIAPIANAASGAVIATSSDDGTVRVWDLADTARPLRGTFAAQGQGTDWVAFTPSGLFDGSPQGVAVVARRSGPQVLRLEQFFERDFAFGVGATVLAGAKLERVAPDPSAAGSRMILELDRARVAVADAAQPGDGPPGPRRATLKVHLPGPDLTDLRVYHNGVAIRSEVPIEKSAGAATASVPVTLVQGRNRFHALASRGDRLDARSNDLDLPGPPAPPGRTHVLALGIDRYSNQQLAYATRDARELAGYLAAQAVGGKARTIEPLVLLDENVSSGSVDEALKKIQDATDRHPEDSVVVFIAGHTDVRDDRYGLLLAGSDPAPGAKLDSDERLPYSMIHRRLARLDALQRLVIIDACQAGAILDDPAVRRIQEIVERESHATRTGYLLAARRGELAGEADELRHGLLTFSVLKGLGSSVAVPPTVADLFRERLNADRDNDLQIDTEELQSYVDQTLPELCRRYPSLVSRGRPDQPPTGANQPPTPLAPEQKLRAQELQGPVFELTVLP
jgi:serine/threonine-protein kinase